MPKLDIVRGLEGGFSSFLTVPEGRKVSTIAPCVYLKTAYVQGPFLVPPGLATPVKPQDIHSTF